MKRSRRVIGALISAVVLLCLWAAPAQADHVTDLVRDGSACRIGGGDTGIGIDVVTTDFQITSTKDGVITGFVCHFTGLPRFVPAEDHFDGVDWYLPKRAEVRGTTCWRDQDGYPEGAGRIVIRPNATASVHCTWLSEAAREMAF